MKHDCDIVRDLMPLCIDNTASENSRKMVGEHVLECQPCMTIYQEMRTEVPKEPPVVKEAEPFSRTVRKLRKQRKRRRIIIGVIGAVLGMLIFLVAASAFTQLTTDYAVMADDDAYDFQLARRTNGQIIITHTNLNGKRQDARWSFDETTGVLKLFAVSPTWALNADRTNTPYLYSDFLWDDETDQLMIRRYDDNGLDYFTDVKEIWKGAKFKGNGYMYQVLYVQGRDIPMVSPEVDAGYLPPAIEYGTDGPTTYWHTELHPFVTVAPTPTPMAQATLAPKPISTPTPAETHPTPMPTTTP